MPGCFPLDADILRIAAIAGIKKEIADITADATIPEKDKKQMLDELAEARVGGGVRVRAPVVLGLAHLAQSARVEVERDRREPRGVDCEFEVIVVGGET